jgi:LuxR family transcriptional regulator, maltose regulon positive regulatory protein
LAARAIEERTLSGDEWGIGVPLLLLLRAYTWLEDFAAVDREAAAAQAMPSVAEPARLVDVRGAEALVWFEAGRLAEAAEAARAADAAARRLGFDQHPFAVDYLRVLAGVALEQRDFDTAEQLTERALSISERFRPVFEFLALLDRAGIWAARRHIHDALATVNTARLSWPGRSPCCWREPTSSRHCCACRSATCARPPNWPAGCPPPGAACCWPGSSSPPATTTPPPNTWTSRR